VARRAGPFRRGILSRAFYCDSPPGPLLVQPSSAIGGDISVRGALPLYAFYSIVRIGGRLSAQPDLRRRLRLLTPPITARRSLHDRVLDILQSIPCSASCLASCW